MKNKKVDELKIGNKIINVEKVEVFGDDRGYFTPVNFESNTKRIYIIKNHCSGIIRGFHGHKFESKIFYAIKGSFKIICMDMKNKEWKDFVINERGNNVIKIPSGIYNGFVSLTDDAELLVISDKTFEESKGDDVRLPYYVLGKEVWGVEHR